jgi:hypothetical protein
MGLNIEMWEFMPSALESNLGQANDCQVWVLGVN